MIFSYAYFTRITASRRVIDDVTNQVMHRVYNTILWFSSAFSTVAFGEKSSPIDDLDTTY